MEPLFALLVTFVLMWLLLIRPQQKRMRQHQQVVASLQAGDEVVTAGGIHGTVVEIDGETLVLSVAPGVELKVLRAAISQRAADPAEDYDDEDYDDEADGDSDDDDETGESVAGGEADGDRS